MTVREPEWDDEQQAWMVALTVYRAGLCPHCRRPLVECAAPEADGRYVVPPPTRCHATTALLAAQEEYQDTHRPGALLWTAERKG